MASIPFGIEFDRIAPPVPTIAAAAEYDAARSRRTIDFFFERLRPRCIGRLQRLDGDPPTGRDRRETVVHQASPECWIHLARPFIPSLAVGPRPAPRRLPTPRLAARAHVADSDAPR